MRKATLKASSEAPAPKAEATTTSRRSPVTREASVNREMVDAARSKSMGSNAILAVFAEFHLASSYTDLTHGHRLQSQEEDRSHRVRPQACSPGHQAQRRQHGDALALPHRHQERAEGGRL